MLYNLHMERAKLLGFGIDTYTFEQAVEAAKKKRGQVVTINPEMIEYGTKNPEFAAILNSAELVIPDGIGVQLGLKLISKEVKRIPGIEFAKYMLSEFKNENIAMIGAKPHVVKKAVENLKEEIPSLNFVYVHDGYFDDDARIIEETVEKRPELVLVALGSPKQEKFIYKLKSKLPNALMIGVGGSFDVWAGEVERAPKFFQKLGLEWLYRTVKEPKRFRRIFPVLPLFVIKVLKEKWS